MPRDPQDRALAASMARNLRARERAAQARRDFDQAVAEALDAGMTVMHASRVTGLTRARVREARRRAERTMSTV